MPMRKFISLLLTVISLHAWAENPPLTQENVAAFFDSAFTVQQKDHEIVGAVVSVVHDGQVLFEAGYGFADLATRTPADPDQSLFRIASITKPFVWTALMQLVEQGRLSLDDPVDQYLDFSIPASYPESIRIRDLLTHTPGFEEQGTGGTARSVADVVPLGEHLQAAMPARVRPPGEHASYSNYGTALAAYVIDRVTGESWSDYIDQQILEPLGMTSTNTQVEMSAELKARHATGYKYSGGEFEATEYEYFKDLPAGHISTTASDMTRFMLMHLNEGTYNGEQVLSAETALEMREPLFDPHPDIAPMLHGFYRSDRHGLVIFGHGGDVNQFHSNLTLIPEHNLGVFVSFNSDPAASARGNLVVAFIDHFFGGEYLRAAPEPYELDLEPFTGQYLPLRRNLSTFEKLSALVSAISVSAQDGALLVTGSRTSRWVPVADDRFVANYVDQSMVFERAPDGSVAYMVIGTPLSTYQRMTGLDRPALQTQVLAFVLIIAVLTVLGYTYRAWRRAPGATQLPRADVTTAWLHGILLIGLYTYLVITLSGDVEEFSYGMPTSAHILMLLMVANVVLGLVVAGMSVRQWLSQSGGTLARLRYSFVALAALANVWICWYFNILAYPLL
jgi:CubicO group peptidase (beta-lactamase class C family)